MPVACYSRRQVTGSRLPRRACLVPRGRSSQGRQGVRGQVLPVAYFSRCWASGSRLPRRLCLVPRGRSSQGRQVPARHVTPTSQQAPQSNRAHPGGCIKAPNGCLVRFDAAGLSPLRAGASSTWPSGVASRFPCATGFWTCGKPCRLAAFARGNVHTSHS